MKPPLVFVADDEQPLREVYREALEMAGYRLDVFPDGESLLRAVARSRPDLILLDINMPGVSGWEVRRRLGSEEPTADIPVVAVTAEGGASVEASMLKTLRFTGFVRKPFRLRELLDAVRAALPRD